MAGVGDVAFDRPHYLVLAHEIPGVNIGETIYHPELAPPADKRGYPGLFQFPAAFYELPPCPWRLFRIEDCPFEQLLIINHLYIIYVYRDPIDAGRNILFVARAEFVLGYNPV